MRETSDTDLPTDYDRLLVEAHAAYVAAGNENAAARLLGLPRTTLTNRLLRYFLRNLDGRLPHDPIPGHVVKGHSATYDKDGNLRSESVKTALMPNHEPFEVPDGHRVKGVSALHGPGGEVIQQWTKTEAVRGTDAVAVLESIRLAAEGLALRPPAQEAAAALGGRGGPDTTADPDLLNLHPLGDLHLGLYVWGQHCGVAWDLPTAIATFKKYMVELIHRSPDAQRGLILVGGDLLHADDETKRTRRSGHILDVDSRYEKVLAETEMLLVFQVELALHKYPEVWVRILPGNHDDDSAVAVTHFLRAWFRHETRVTVEATPNPHFVHEWGSTMLGGAHGHEVKIENLRDVMTADHAEIWGRTRYRYMHGFHWHTGKLGDEKGGASWQVHQTPIPRDAFAHNFGFRSGRSMRTITYSKLRGETGESVETL